MTPEETLTVFRKLKRHFTYFYHNLPESEFQMAVMDWHRHFANEDYGMVNFVVDVMIETRTDNSAPKIADVKKALRDLVHVSTGEPTDEELWRMLRKAASNGTYGAKDEFERLPPVLKRYCGSPSTLRELAVQDEKTLDTVVHGQFLRQIVSIRERQQYHDSLPEGVKDAVSRLYGRMDGDRVLTPAEENERRNAVLDTLERG